MRVQSIVDDPSTASQPVKNIKQMTVKARYGHLDGAEEPITLYFKYKDGPGTEHQLLSIRMNLHAFTGYGETHEHWPRVQDALERLKTSFADEANTMGLVVIDATALQKHGLPTLEAVASQ